MPTLDEDRPKARLISVTALCSECWCNLFMNIHRHGVALKGQLGLCFVARDIASKWQGLVPSSFPVPGDYLRQKWSMDTEKLSKHFNAVYLCGAINMGSFVPDHSPPFHSYWKCQPCFVLTASSSTTFSVAGYKQMIKTVKMTVYHP